MSDEELLPCPFCGSNRLKEQIVTNTGGNVRYIWCMGCNAKGPWFGGGHPDNNWNTRAHPLKSRLRDGWVMVPVEPTMGMYDDFRAAEKEERNGFDGFYSGYRAMLSARPKESQ